MGRYIIPRKRAFTLVELLVVISIISLLMAILVPALSQVRKQAKLVLCQANIRQIGLAVETYRAGNEMGVPIALNTWATRTYSYVPAEHSLLSVALRDYVGVRLPAGYNPHESWASGGTGYGTDKAAVYMAKYMPKFFACPLIRRKKSGTWTGWTNVGSVMIGGEVKNICAFQGVEESYYTWRHPIFTQRPNKWGIAYSPRHPLGYPHGHPKYGSLAWNKGHQLNSSRGALHFGWMNNEATYRKGISSPARWTAMDCKKVGSSNAAAILFCSQGEWDNHSDIRGYVHQIANYGKHPKGKKGGTNVLMTDMHVEWVPGTQVGWW